jgi:uncharacterized membrane protein
MPEPPENTNRLLEKVEALIKRQDALQQEISALKAEISSLFHTGKPVEYPPAEPQTSAQPAPGATGKRKERSDVEKFIGENLINKIGIAITIIGVGIGAKYAIDHQLISPWTRIILGYLVGISLFGFAVRLRKQYENFSAVLLSGSMAIMYFITFAAFSFYDLIPVIPTFTLMVLFTMFTVGAAMKYNTQVIAHIGLVGAYAVPFLLSDGTGNVVFLFSYMAIINLGILGIAFVRRWKFLNYSSFVLIWLIVNSWYFPNYVEREHFLPAMIFISIFFATFYLIFLADKLMRKEIPDIADILIFLVNAYVFYGLGYATLGTHTTTEGLLGAFTLGNALIHGAVAAVAWYKFREDRTLFYYIAGLGLVFATIAIPVQLNGHWVTLLWSAEAAVLFWLGRTKNLLIYELLSYPLMIVVFFNLLNGWNTEYHAYDPQYPETRVLFLLNAHLLTSIFVIASYGFIQYIKNLKSHASPLIRQRILLQFMNVAIPVMLLMVLYFSFYKEISTFWRQLYVDSRVITNGELTIPQCCHDGNLLIYSSISLFIYSLLFFSLLSFVNIKWLKNMVLGLFNLGLNTIFLGVFLTLGLYAIGELRESYVSREHAEFYYRGMLTIGIRYISFAFVGLTLYALSRYIREEFIKINLKTEFELLLVLTILTIAGNELINWMDLYQPGQSYKLGLSILFGIYALLMVGIGIWKRKVHLRIAAIVLFSATLLKLFFYDLTDMDTISKTIVFVILGVLLLIISFLYNKYRGVIFEKRDA